MVGFVRQSCVSLPLSAVVCFDALRAVWYSLFCVTCSFHLIPLGNVALQPELIYKGPSKTVIVPFEWLIRIEFHRDVNVA